MQKALLAAAVLAALALAGCSGGGEHDPVQPVTCPDGTVLTADQVEADPHHHDGDFDGAALCPVKPSVNLSGVPASVQAFKPAAFSWILDNGTLPHAHSMLTSIRMSDTSIPDSDLTSLSKYPTEVIKREHQDLPITYNGNLSISKPGKVYVRAYMEVSGEDYWSPEIAVDVLPVQPTGTVHQVNIPAGAGVVAQPSPEQTTAILGDAIQLVNEDLVATECEYQSGPQATAPVTADAPVVLTAPGTYEFSCDSVQESSFKVVVTVS